MAEKKKNVWINGSIIFTFVSLYLLVATISMFHIVDFFELSNSNRMAWTLSIAFELGSMAALAGLVILNRLKEGIVYFLFGTLVLFQMMGNVYYSYINLTIKEVTPWVELFWLDQLETIDQKRILAFVSGLPLPLIALGFIKSLIDYLKPENLTDEKDENKIQDEGYTSKTKNSEDEEQDTRDQEQHQKNEEDQSKVELEIKQEKTEKIKEKSIGVKNEEKYRNTQAQDYTDNNDSQESNNEQKVAADKKENVQLPEDKIEIVTEPEIFDGDSNEKAVHGHVLLTDVAGDPVIKSPLLSKDDISELGLDPDKEKKK